MQNEKIAVFTTCDDNYIIPSIVTFESIRRFHPDFEFYIFGEFKEFDKVKIITDTFNIALVEFDSTYSYKDAFRVSDNTPLWPKSCFGYFEAYNKLLQSGFRHSLYVDADVLCNKPFCDADMFESVKGISAVRKKNSVINSGVIFINNEYLSTIKFTEIALDYYLHRKVCEHKECPGFCHEKGDQDLLSEIVKGEKILFTELDSAYNYLLHYPIENYFKTNKKIFTSPDEIVFMHIMFKPWLPEASQIQPYPLLQNAYMQWKELAVEVINFLPK